MLVLVPSSPVFFGIHSVIDEPQSPAGPALAGVSICSVDGECIVGDEVARFGRTGNFRNRILRAREIGDALAKTECSGSAMRTEAPSVRSPDVSQATRLFVDGIEGQPQGDGMARVEFEVEPILMRWGGQALAGWLIKILKILRDGGLVQKLFR